MKIAEAVLNRLNKDYLLPSIQREFIWLENPAEKRIEKLFDSILQEYPFGSILTWSIDKAPALTQLDWEVYEFIKDYDSDNPHNNPANINGFSKLFLILDGQQRLTALNIGLRGSFTKKKKLNKLYINLFSDIENDPDNEFGFKYEFKFLANISQDDNELWFEVGKVLNYHDKNTEVFKQDYDSIIKDKTSNNDLIIKAKMILGQLHKRICTDDTLYEPAPISTADDEKVLNIFVRTNDGGVKLEKADLLLSYMESNKKSVFTPNGARKEITDFVDSLNKEETHKPNYNFAKDDVLKTSLVLSNLEVQYKLKNFNEKNLIIISNNWLTIKKYLECTVKLIARYGFSSKNIISKNSLIPIAFFFQTKNISTSFVASQANQDLEQKNEIIKWLVVSQLTRAFGSSSDTTLKSVRESIKSGKSFKEINFGRIIEKEDVEKWINRESFGSKYSHLLLLLITKNKYWDECQQDHIFPDSKFNEEEFKKLSLTDMQIKFYEKYKNSIINLHLLNPLVNIVKSNDDFIDWGHTQNRDFLESSLIPTDIDLSFSNFENFIEKRKEKLINKIYELLRPSNP
ncbi:MAG: DUF262 domain-containing protein [Thermodesulfovibrionales bacterium]|nr:DUF262 domain-containing protein [Thermodesulfovibrionales bacterium]